MALRIPLLVLSRAMDSLHRLGCLVSYGVVLLTLVLVRSALLVPAVAC